MKTALSFLFSVGFFGIVTGQNNNNPDFEIINHHVMQGETVRMISLKYLVTPSDIYKYNKFAIDGIRQGMTLQIPVKRKAPKADVQEKLSDDGDGTLESSSASEPDTGTAKVSDEIIEHRVEAKETLYSISRKYNIPVDIIKQQNDELLAHGLKAGQVIRIKPNN